jgi:hypothetical protein
MPAALVAVEQWTVLAAQFVLTALAESIRKQQYPRNDFWEFVSQDVLLYVITKLGNRTVTE